MLRNSDKIIKISVNSPVVFQKKSEQTRSNITDIILVESLNTNISKFQEQNIMDIKDNVLELRHNSFMQYVDES